MKYSRITIYIKTRPKRLFKCITVSLDFTRLTNLKNFMNSMKYFMEKMKNYGQDEYLMLSVKYFNKGRIPNNFQTQTLRTMRDILSRSKCVN